MVLSLRCFLKYVLYFVFGAVVLAAGFIAYLIWFQPVFYLPKPTGQHAVGMHNVHWVDKERKEPFNNDPAHPYRELMVKIWYPAVGILSDKPIAPYSPDLVNYLKKNQKLMWLLGFSRPVYSYAQHRAPVISDVPQFPVILFSHGAGGANYESYTALCEELASQGYIVVGINHTYCSLFTQFPDGRAIDGRGAIKKEGPVQILQSLKKSLIRSLKFGLPMYSLCLTRSKK